MSNFASSPVAAVLNFASQTASRTPPAPLSADQLSHLEGTNDPALTPRSILQVRSPSWAAGATCASALGFAVSAGQSPLLGWLYTFPLTVVVSVPSASRMLRITLIFSLNPPGPVTLVPLTFPD